MRTAKWLLTKTEQIDGTAHWDLYNRETEKGHSGRLAQRIAASLKARGIPVDRNTDFAYSRASVGLHVGQ